MRHQIRFTLEKISLRLKEIEGLVYHRRELLSHFSYLELDRPGLSPAEIETGDLEWQSILPQSYWALPRTDFALKTSFRIPADWNIKGGPLALYLPIGISWDFSHPEALVYLDGKRIASCDRHHQEVLLPDETCDGKDHQLILIGWTGIGGATAGDMSNQLKMGSPEVVQLDLHTRSFLATARVTLGIAKHLDKQDPTYYHLLTSLDDALILVDLRLPIRDNFYSSIGEAHQHLKTGLDKAGQSLDVDLTALPGSGRSTKPAKNLAAHSQMSWV
jgi:alpha-mannosidase